VQSLLTDAIAQSAVINDLIRRLAQTDTFAYVELTASPEVPTARTKLVTAVAGARFVRIALNMLLSRWDRLPLLAHELQHAVEVAEDRDVTSPADLRVLYRRVGIQTGADRYDSIAARRAGYDVLREEATNRRHSTREASAMGSLTESAE